MKKEKPVCKLTDCGKPHHGKGYCEMHYNQYRLTQAPSCVAEDCSKPARARQMCHAHYSAWLISTNEKNVIDYDDFWEFVKKQLKIGESSVR
jgi:hypothetical protein